MQLRLVDLAAISCPVARIAVARRRMISSEYRLSASNIFEKIQGTISRTGLSQGPETVEIVSFCSAERACATLVTAANTTILLDIGFIELISDFLSIWFGIQNRYEFSASTIQEVGVPFSGFTASEQTLHREHLFSLLLRESWSTPASNAEHESQSAGKPSDASRDAIEPEDMPITGSQIARDIAIKLCDVKSFPAEGRILFDAGMLWPLEVGENVYRPGALLFNFLAHAASHAGDVAAIWFNEAIREAASLLILHEVSHVLFDRTVISAWPEKRDYAAILRWLQKSTSWGDGNLSFVRLWLNQTGVRNDPRLQRSTDESFFDMRALDLTMTANRIGGSHADVQLIMAHYLSLKCINVTIMILRDHLAASLDTPQLRNSIGKEAERETIFRCLWITCYLLYQLDDNFPGAKHETVIDRFKEIISQIALLYKFFTIDITNGFPSDIDGDEEGTQMWIRLVEVMAGAKQL